MNQTDSIQQRIENKEISREISAKDILDGNPSKERILGRLEAYLTTGVLIETEELEEVFAQYPLTKEEFRYLGTLIQQGINEGLVQEPGNLAHLGIRAALLPYFVEKYMAQEE